MTVIALPSSAVDTAAVQVQGNSRSFGAVHALELVDLTARAGEVTALVGPNGGGKTPLLLILATLHRQWFRIWSSPACVLAPWCHSLWASLPPRTARRSPKSKTSGSRLRVDRALQRVGFLVITGHGISADLISTVRAAARAFFALPQQAKEQCAIKVGGRGWLSIGAEAKEYSEGTETPPDLREFFIVGSQPRTESDSESAWFAHNVWPTQTPVLQVQLELYLKQMRALADGLLGPHTDFGTLALLAIC